MKRRIISAVCEGFEVFSEQRDRPFNAFSFNRALMLKYAAVSQKNQFVASMRGIFHPPLLKRSRMQRQLSASK